MNKYRKDGYITGVPENTYSYVLDFCTKLPGVVVNPVYVFVSPKSDSVVNECFVNVENIVKKYGGKSVFGWQIWEFYGVMIEAEFHSIWLTPENKLIDITPKQLPFKRILFVETPDIFYTGKQTNNIRKSLLKDNILVDEFIQTSENIFKILNNGERATQTSINLSNDEKTYLMNLQRRLLNLQVSIIESVPKRNDPCRCGAGLKYKKCCGK